MGSMKALVKGAAEPGLTWSDVPEPEIGRDDVLIKVLKTGICGTDLHIYAWVAWAADHVDVPLVARHAGARHIVVADVADYRLELARSLGVSGAVDVRAERLADAMAGLRMTEGFDVGLEMSGHADALRSMLATMRHGGSVAMLG